MDTRTSKHKAGVAAVIMCLVLGVAGVVAAQSGPTSECSGDSVTTFGTEYYGLGQGGNRLLSTSPTSIDFAMATPLPAGTYSLNAVSYDGYDERELVAPQTQEQWFAEFISSSGSVLATSALTVDLEDLVTEANWAGSLGEVTLAAPAASVRVRHAAPGSNSVNSVRPVCLGATDTSVVTTTEAPTETTEAPAVVAPVSLATVDFVSTASSASTVSLVCGDLTESATGTDVNLRITDIPASSACVVEYPSDLNCTVGVDPSSVTRASAAGVQNFAIPASGDLDVSITIDCVEAQVAVATTTAPAAVVTTTTTAPAVTPEVDGQVETAPTASAQTGQPAFTG